MKPISEYNFREIVGQFVMLQGVSVSPAYDKYLAYCYIDQEKGMSFRILGMYSLEDSKVVVDELIILRYNTDIRLEIFDCPGDSLLKIAKEIDQNYNTEIINSIRNISEYDPYRDKIFPDDLFLLTFALVNDEVKVEPLWIHPFEKLDDNVYGEIIEQGENISKGTQVVIMNKELFFKDQNKDVPSVFALTFDVVERILKEEETQNEI